MRGITAVFKVILLALRPLSGAADVWGWRDIFNFIINLFGWGGRWLFMLDSLDWFNPYWLAIFPAILLLIAGVKLQRNVDVYESKLPCIIFGSGEVATGVTYETAEFTPPDKGINRSKPIGDLYMVYIFVKNDPVGYRTEERTARKAASIIEVYDTDNLKTPVKSFWGKWRDKPQASSRPHHVSISDLMEFDLPPNGIPHRIDFAIKYHADEDMYGYNDEAHRYSSDGRFAELKLTANNFFIRVKLKAIGLKDEPSWWYEIEHQGKQSKPTIRRLSKDAIKRLGY